MYIKEKPKLIVKSLKNQSSFKVKTCQDSMTLIRLKLKSIMSTKT